MTLSSGYVFTTSAVITGTYKSCEQKVVKMLVWSMYEESLYAERALRSGAMGYINKQQVTDTIIDAIRTIIGQGMCTKEIAKAMSLSPKTIETYRARIKEKLEFDDMPSLSREATQWVLENS